MKRISAILLDYAKNALRAAVIGALVAIAVALALGENVLRLGNAGAYALIGLACGTCSKAAIEGAFSLFGARRLLAYVLNAAVIAILILVLVHVFFDGFGGMDPWVVALIFALPEAASVLLVRAELEEALRLERAFDERRKALDTEEDE
jgi:hypothetical protein